MELNQKSSKSDYQSETVRFVHNFYWEERVCVYKFKRTKVKKNPKQQKTKVTECEIIVDKF